MAKESEASQKESKSNSKQQQFGGDDDAEPMNPGLTEPDAMAIVQKDNTAAPSVGLERKQQLLVKARADRRKWVQKVPLPYSNPNHTRDPNNVWSLQEKLLPVQTSLASQRIPAATKVLSELYGLENQTRTPEEVANRVDALIRPFVGEEHELLEEEQAAVDEALKRDDSEATQAFYDFWKTLLKPECALLVQKMRNFLGNLQDSDMDRVSTAMKSYLDSTFDSLKSHQGWKEKQVDTNVRRSLESFVYGHAQPLLDSLEWTGLFTMNEEEWVDRLDLFQFIEPKHLEIGYLTAEGLPPVEELLKAPMEALLSIENYYSPYEKLQRILAVYQGVNEALSEALNQSNKSGADRKLPSADDVLPTIIFTVLRAKPRIMFRNLQFVEVFSPQEYLRGEAGYAYTNLYGAVQFLHDLNINKPDSLSISPEDFRKGMEDIRKSVAEKRTSVVDGTASTNEMAMKRISVDISVRDVRNARLRGEQVDLNWAMRHQEKHVVNNEGGNDESRFTATLPDGFNRTYNFLGARPEDIRMSDLPKLLEEYRMLAHVTEQMLGERAARLAAEKRKKDAERAQSLDDTFYGIESS